MPSSASPHRSSGSGRRHATQVKAAAEWPRLDAFRIDTFLGSKSPEKPLHCTGWEADHCVNDIETADFIALRFDPAPDTTLQQDQTSAEAFYEACLSRLDESIPLRLGLCCCKWQASTAVWEMRSHELGLFPGDLLKMPQDVEASRRDAAIRASSSDCHSESAIRALSRKDSGPNKWSGQVAGCTKWVVDALRAVKLPLVVHNGLFDLMHLSDKFLGVTPQDHIALGQLLSTDFPIIFDTGVMVHSTEQSLLDLDTTRKKLVGLLKDKEKLRLKEFGMYTHRASSKTHGQVFGRGVGAAARDAMLVAEAFLHGISHSISDKTTSMPKAVRNKRPWSDSPRTASETDGSPARKNAKRTEWALHESESTPPRSVKKGVLEEVKHVSTPCKSLSPKTEAPADLDLDANILRPDALKLDAACIKLHNRIASPGFAGLDLRSSKVARTGDLALDVHALLRDLGAKEDSRGRPVVTPSMAKQLRKMLAERNN